MAGIEQYQHLPLRPQLTAEVFYPFAQIVVANQVAVVFLRAALAIKGYQRFVQLICLLFVVVLNLCTVTIKVNNGYIARPGLQQVGIKSTSDALAGGICIGQNSDILV